MGLTEGLGNIGEGSLGSHSLGCRDQAETVGVPGRREDKDKARADR